MISIRMKKSLRSWCIKGTDKSLSTVDSAVPLMYHDPNDLGSLILIRIISKERTHSFAQRIVCFPQSITAFFNSASKKVHV